jgi:hypothetical protein
VGFFFISYRYGSPCLFGTVVVRLTPARACKSIAHFTRTFMLRLRSSLCSHVHRTRTDPLDQLPVTALVATSCTCLRGALRVPLRLPLHTARRTLALFVFACRIDTICREKRAALISQCAGGLVVWRRWRYLLRRAAVSHRGAKIIRSSSDIASDFAGSRTSYCAPFAIAIDGGVYLVTLYQQHDGHRDSRNPGPFLCISDSEERRKYFYIYTTSETMESYLRQ